MSEPPPAITSVVSSALAAGREIATIGLLGGWIALWSLVVRSHYAQGQMASVAVTAVITVLPAVAGLVWRLSRLVDVTVGLPDVDLAGIGPLESG